MTLEEYWASAVPGTENFCAQELASIGIKQVSPAQNGVTFYSDCKSFYRACLSTRLNTGIHAVIGRTSEASIRSLGALADNIDWLRYFRKANSFDVRIEGLPVKKPVAEQIKTNLIQSIKKGLGSFATPHVSTQNPDVSFVVLVRKRKYVILASASSEVDKRPEKDIALSCALFQMGWNKTSNSATLMIPFVNSSNVIDEIIRSKRGTFPQLAVSHWCFEHWKAFSNKTFLETLDEVEDAAMVRSDAICKVLIADPRNSAKNIGEGKSGQRNVDIFFTKNMFKIASENEDICYLIDLPTLSPKDEIAFAKKMVDECIKSFGNNPNIRISMVSSPCAVSKLPNETIQAAVSARTVTKIK